MLNHFYDFRLPRRSSSIFPPISEDHATSGEESGTSFSGRASVSNPGPTGKLRGTVSRSSASSAVLKSRKSSDVLQLPHPEHGTLVRTRSQEQVQRITEYLFSGRTSQGFLDPNSALGDDFARRTSSPSSGKRKISMDHLFTNLGLTPGKSSPSLVY